MRAALSVLRCDCLLRRVSCSSEPPAAAALPSAPCVSAWRTRRRRVSCRAQPSSRDAGSDAVPRPASLAAFCAELDAALGKTVDDRAQEAAVQQLVERAQAGGELRAFGRARQLPKRTYTIDELRLNKIEPEKLLAPRDESLGRVRNTLQAAAAAGLAALAVTSGLDLGRVVGVLAPATFLLFADQVANAGGGEALLVDTAGRLLDSKYARRVALHEAGHMLVAYLVGVMPKAYTLSSLDAFVRYRALNIQAGTTFCDTTFEAEVAAGRLRSGTLDKYTCVALAGVVTEYLFFGQAEGGVGDVAQLDRLFRALQFTQKKADSEVRWAVLNAALLLRRHAALHERLAAAMAGGASVGECVRVIEEALAGSGDMLGPLEGGGSEALVGLSGGDSSADVSQQER